VTKKVSSVICPCGGAVYEQCCGRFHQGALPESAEQLMRSRYSAYVLGLTEYVHWTWHASTRPSLYELQHDPATKWLGLEVKRHQANGDEAIVEFVARCKVGGRAQRLQETSRFVREDGRWLYVDGRFADTD
jgi:SEC-C motif domain protein